MTYDLPVDTLDRSLVLDFFWKFSVFECALKREGFLRVGRYNTAEPDWTKFGKSIAGRFAEIRNVDGFNDAIQKLKDASPRRQIVRNDELSWENLRKQANDSEEEFVLRLVKTVRNNLFHGGKYPDGPIAEVARDRIILKAALAILDGCCKLHPGMTNCITRPKSMTGQETALQLKAGPVRQRKYR